MARNRDAVQDQVDVGKLCSSLEEPLEIFSQVGAVVDLLQILLFVTVFRRFTVLLFTVEENHVEVIRHNNDYQVK